MNDNISLSASRVSFFSTNQGWQPYCLTLAFDLQQLNPQFINHKSGFHLWRLFCWTKSGCIEIKKYVKKILISSLLDLIINMSQSCLIPQLHKIVDRATVHQQVSEGLEWSSKVAVRGVAILAVPDYVQHLPTKKKTGTESELELIPDSWRMPPR